MPGQTVADVMTAQCVTVASVGSATEAAEQMRDHNIGDVLVVENDQLVGLLTDRDLAVRLIAEALDPASTTAAEVCSADIVTVTVDTTADEAANLMRQNALRRLPVLDDTGRLAGVVTMGDLAIVNDPSSALSDVSAAPPNR